MGSLVSVGVLVDLTSIRVLVDMDGVENLIIVKPGADAVRETAFI